MDISTSDLILNISPATIRTMSGIAAGLSKQEVCMSHDVRKPVLGVFTWSDTNWPVQKMARSMKFGI